MELGGQLEQILIEMDWFILKWTIYFWKEEDNAEDFRRESLYTNNRPVSAKKKTEERSHEELEELFNGYFDI